MPIAYHYCSLESFYYIVESGKLRLGNVYFMNDYMEVGWFMSVCTQVLAEDREYLLKEECRRVTPNSDGSSTSTGTYGPRSHFCDTLSRLLNEPQFDHVYCSCFSLAQDDLSQWRGYADHARGIAFGIDLEAIKAANPESDTLDIQKVIYDEQEQRLFARNAIRGGVGPTSSTDAKDQAVAKAALLRYRAPAYKNPAFASEKEIRLIAQTGLGGNGIDMTRYHKNLFDGMPSQPRFAPRRGTLIPYVEAAIPPPEIKEVWFGPRFGTGMEIEAVKMFLSWNGVKAELHESKASYRE